MSSGHRWEPWAASATVFLAVVFLWHTVLWGDCNLIYRDAGHFYYPLFQYIESQWSAGYTPLWNPAENCGEPLLANPTSSVCYPGKIFFRLLPYPIAFKVYHLGHWLLAGMTMWIATRYFGLGFWPSVFAAVAYAGSGFVFFQIYNIVFLVGAAWLPLAFVAMDSLTHRPALGPAALLASVLTLQVLGGDPETAYLTGVIGVLYALFTHAGPLYGLMAIAGAGLAGYSLNHFRAKASDWQLLPDADASLLPLGVAVLGVLALAGLGLMIFAWWGYRRRRREAALEWLMLAGGLAGLLAAVQILPTMEWIGRSNRASLDLAGDSAGFSIFPARLAELLAPSFWGRIVPYNTGWAPFRSWEVGIWVPNLYAGILTLVFGFLGFRLLHGDRRAMLWTWMFALSTLAAFGKFGGPAWMFDPNLGRPFDAVYTTTSSGQFGEVDGLYWLMEETLPGFHSFRYPAKLFLFASFALAMLAGTTFDRIARETSPCEADQAISSRCRLRTRRVLFLLSAALAFAGVTVWLASPWISEIWSRDPFRPDNFGPFVVSWAIHDLVFSLVQAGSVAFGGAWLLGRPLDSRRQFGLVALLLVDVSLSLAPLVFVDSQSAIDEEPVVVRIIHQHASEHDDGQPYRIHRTRIYSPIRFARDPGSQQRSVDVSRWERQTAQPKYALPWGMEYTSTVGTMGLLEMEFFFSPWTFPLPEGLKGSNRESRGVLVYFPRNGFNLWNTRYFVLPRLAVLDHDERGILTLRTTAEGKPLEVLLESPGDADDFQVLINTEAMPRAWIVHRADIRAPLRTDRVRERRDRFEDLLYRPLDAGVPIWRSDHRRPFPIREQVLIEAPDHERIAEFFSGRPVDSREAVRITRYEPDRLTMEANLQSPGVVVLADAYFPGWTATVDGEPAEVVRVNQMMRGIPTRAGNHVIEMRYRSRPFEIGVLISLGTLLALVVTLTWKRFRGRKLAGRKSTDDVH